MDNSGYRDIIVEFNRTMKPLDNDMQRSGRLVPTLCGHPQEPLESRRVIDWALAFQDPHSPHFLLRRMIGRRSKEC